MKLVACRWVTDPSTLFLPSTFLVLQPHLLGIFSWSPVKADSRFVGRTGLH